MGSNFTLKKEGPIGVVVINVAGEAMNTWTDEAISDGVALLDVLEKADDLKGVIFISGKRGNFHAGANLKVLEGWKGKEDVIMALDVMHGIFNRISALNIPTLAAIDGHCLGGGLEFALACTSRIATNSKGTVMGLPETNLGLFPGAGGTQRLPRLIGQAAIELIVRGQVLSAAKAFELGIIDRLVPEDGDLLKEAKSFLQGILSGDTKLSRPVHDFSDIDALSDQVRKSAIKAARGRELPAPMLAIRSMQEGVKVPLAQGLEIEKKYFVDVAMSGEAMGSINTFFLKTMTDKPKGLMTKGFSPKPLKRAAVLGFGTMGRGIVIEILRNMMIPVLVKDIPAALEPGKAFVRKILTGMEEKRRLIAPVDYLMSLITLTSEYSETFKDMDIVVEAVFEEPNVKAQVYKDLSSAVRKDCLIASNTSFIPIDHMAKDVAHPERFGGTHFFSPVWMMQLVEVVRGEKTSQETVDNLISFAASIRKRPLVCRDNPGFVVNAMLRPYLQGIYECLEAGNAIERIDDAMLRFGMPVGPIRLTDEVGIDVIYKVFTEMKIKQDTLTNVVQDGRLGLKKSGKGFFLKDGTVDPSVFPLIGKREVKEASIEEIQMNALTAMVTAGKDLLERKIVEDPRMIDMGLIWGTGFPPDKGGPMKWADLTGLSERLFGGKFYK